MIHIQQVFLLLKSQTGLIVTKNVIDYQKWKENENFQNPFNLEEPGSNKYEEYSNNKPGAGYAK